MDLFSDPVDWLYVIIPLIIILIAAGIYFAWLFEKKRIAKLQLVAESLGFIYEDKGGEFLLPSLEHFYLFSQGHSKKITNILKGSRADADISILDYHFTQGGGKNSSTLMQTVILFESDQLLLPAFTLRPENMFHKIGSAFGYQDIDFETHAEFSKQYLLRGANEEDVRRTFDFSLLSWIELQKNLCIEGDGKKLLFYQSGKRVKPDEMHLFLEKGLELFNQIRK